MPIILLVPAEIILSIILLNTGVYQIATSAAPNIPTESQVISTNETPESPGEDLPPQERDKQHVLDHEPANLPITRVYTRRNNSAGGLQVMPDDDHTGTILPTYNDNLPIAL